MKGRLELDRRFLNESAAAGPLGSNSQHIEGNLKGKCCVGKDCGQLFFAQRALRQAQLELGWRPAAVAAGDLPANSAEVAAQWALRCLSVAGPFAPVALDFVKFSGATRKLRSSFIPFAPAASGVFWSSR